MRGAADAGAAGAAGADASAVGPSPQRLKRRRLHGRLPGDLEPIHQTRVKPLNTRKGPLCAEP